MTNFDPEKENKCLWRSCGCALDNVWCWVCCGGTTVILGVCGVIIFIALMALAVHDVDENEMAIEYNAVSRNIGGIITAGKHFLPPATELFRYDRKFITNNLDLECVTRDGLYVTLEVTQQYQLVKDDLKEILLNFGEQEFLDKYIDIIAQDTIRGACSNFTGAQYFSQRGDVETTMIHNMIHAIDNSNSYSVPGFVQLRNIQLPRELLNAIEDKQLALEDVDVATQERAQQLIQKETEKQQALVDAEIVLVAAEAVAGAVLVQANESARARGVQWQERTNAFLIDLVALQIGPEEYVDSYLFPRLRASTLTPEQQACLQTCPEGTACWFCFTTASPAVVV